MAQNVLESGVRGYMRMRKEQLEGTRRVNRDQRDGKREREEKDHWKGNIAPGQA